MKSNQRSCSLVRSRRGQTLALMAVAMAGLLGVAALGVDVGYLYVARNQLQNVADGSALAGARQLGYIYQNLTYGEQQGFECTQVCIEAIKGAAEAVAQQNVAAGKLMSLQLEDIQIGQWDGDNFTATLNEPDAIQILSRRDEVYNGPVTTFFARALGYDMSSVRAIATAAMTGQGTAWEGDIELPIGISRYFFDQYEDDGSGEPAWCHETIRFYPTNDPLSCAGWTSWEYNSNDANLRKILDENPNYPSPETIANETVFNFTGGTLSEPTFTALLELFQEKGWAANEDGSFFPDGEPTYRWYEAEAAGAPPLMVEDTDGTMIQAEWPDGSPRYYHRWDTTVPVYDRGDCSNPNQSILIVGFAQVQLTDVLSAPNKLVEGKVLCNLTGPDDNRGGGGEYGIKGPIPGLVK